MPVDQPTRVHVLQLIDGLNVGGAEMLMRDLVLGLMKRGYRVSLGYSTEGPMVQEIASSGAKMTHLPRLARIDPLLLAGMIRLIRSDRPQIVHTHLFKSDFHGRLAARMCGVPVVVSTLHNTDAWARQKPFGTLYGWTARKADCNIAVADEVRKYHMRYSGIPGEKVLTIENGVDVSRFQNGAQSGQQFRKELGIPVDSPLLAVIGRLVPQKDHENFLHAAVEIRQSRPDARFLVVGDGPRRAELEALSHSLGLEQAVTFTGLRKDIPAILAAMDLLVFSSSWEGLPITLLEGMAAGKPAVCTAVDGILSVVIPDVTAVVVPPGDSKALALGCLRVLGDPELARRMGKAGLERVRSHFSIDTMIDRTSRLYRDLLRQRGIIIQRPESVEAR